MTDVTVLMAIHNAMPHLPEAVESMRSQTLRDWKMVVVNDGSTDDSVDYLTSLNDDRIQIIHQENAGLGAALNHGLEFCHTPLIARMDGDDISYPSRLAQQVAFLESHPAVGLVGTQIARMGSRRASGNSALATDHDTIFGDISRGINQMYHPTIMCRTDLIKAIGGYWEHPRGEEWDLFLRMGERAQLANLNDVLLSYRIHTGSMTGLSVKEIRTWIEYACECSRRRREGSPSISFDDFVQQLQRHPWHHRLARACDLHSRTQYRIGLGERLGERPLIGGARIAYSALWSPSLCFGRLRRETRRLLGATQTPSKQSNAEPHESNSDQPTNPSTPISTDHQRNQLNTISLLGLNLHQLTMPETVDHIFHSLDQNVGGWVMTPNVDILRRWTRNADFRSLTGDVSLCIADGMPLVWASRIAGTPLPQRLNGTNLTRILIAEASVQGRSVFFLGGAPGTADQAAAKMQEAYPDLKVAGTHCPPFGFENDDQELAKIQSALEQSNADIVLVALGSPKQERLIASYRAQLPNAWWLGVGATFDFLSGRIARAPRWMQRCGLEWTHRLCQEPKRLAHRYLVDDIPFALGMLGHSARARVFKNAPSTNPNEVILNSPGERP